MSDFSYIRLTSSAGAKRYTRVFSKPIQYRFEIWAFWTVILELPEASEVDLKTRFTVQKGDYGILDCNPAFSSSKTAY